LKKNWQRALEEEVLLQEKAGKRSEVWQKIKVDGDALSAPYVSGRTKGNKSKKTLRAHHA
jgi:hypothetical protein